VHRSSTRRSRWSTSPPTAWGAQAAALLVERIGGAAHPPRHAAIDAEVADIEAALQRDLQTSLWKPGGEGVEEADRRAVTAATQLGRFIPPDEA
jgi:hypothetical protein